MDKTIRKYTSFEEMKADEYRYWQSHQGISGWNRHPKSVLPLTR
jgi:hypothetical protein